MREARAETKKAVMNGFDKKVGIAVLFGCKDGQ
jgi:hypothetical protein